MSTILKENILNTSEDQFTDRSSESLTQASSEESKSEPISKDQIQEQSKRINELLASLRANHKKISDFPGVVSDLEDTSYNNGYIKGLEEGDVNGFQRAKAEYKIKIQEAYSQGIEEAGKVVQALITDFNLRKQTAKSENEALKIENEALKLENMALKIENEALKLKNRALEVNNENLDRQLSDEYKKIVELYRSNELLITYVENELKPLLSKLEVVESKKYVEITNASNKTASGSDTIFSPNEEKNVNSQASPLFKRVDDISLANYLMSLASVTDSSQKSVRQLLQITTDSVPSFQSPVFSIHDQFQNELSDKKTVEGNADENTIPRPMSSAFTSLLSGVNPKVASILTNTRKNHRKSLTEGLVNSDDNSSGNTKLTADVNNSTPLRSNDDLAFHKSDTKTNSLEQDTTEHDENTERLIPNSVPTFPESKSKHTSPRSDVMPTSPLLDQYSQYSDEDIIGDHTNYVVRRAKSRDNATGRKSPEHYDSPNK